MIPFFPAHPRVSVDASWGLLHGVVYAATHTWSPTSTGSVYLDPSSLYVEVGIMTTGKWRMVTAQQGKRDP